MQGESFWSARSPHARGSIYRKQVAAAPFPARAGMNGTRSAVSRTSFLNPFPARAGMNRRLPHSTTVPRTRGDEPSPATRWAVPRTRGDEPSTIRGASRSPFPARAGMNRTSRAGRAHNRVPARAGMNRTAPFPARAGMNRGVSRCYGRCTAEMGGVRPRATLPA